MKKHFTFSENHFHPTLRMEIVEVSGSRPKDLGRQTLTAATHLPKHDTENFMIVTTASLPGVLTNIFSIIFIVGFAMIYRFSGTNFLYFI